MQQVLNCRGPLHAMITARRSLHSIMLIATRKANRVDKNECVELVGLGVATKQPTSRHSSRLNTIIILSRIRQINNREARLTLEDSDTNTVEERKAEQTGISLIFVKDLKSQP